MDSHAVRSPQQSEGASAGASACRMIATEEGLLTDDDLREIERRIKAATPGPWCHRDQFIETVSAPEQLLGVTMQRNEDGLDQLPGHANACFIAHARDDIERLLAEVRRLRSLRNGNS